MIYDLHSHTTASDGSLSPAELVQRAVENRVDVLAITDHDTTAGLAEAQKTIQDLELPLTLVTGVEISTNWQNHEIHIVALNVDLSNANLQAFLSEQCKKREQRAIEMGNRLAKARIPDAYAGAKALAGDAAITRSHFAKYLVEQGVENTFQNVFKRFLAKGKTGYVPPNWATIEQTIEIIKESGGQAVLAHPLQYKLTTKWFKRLLSAFQTAGGDAMEVGQPQQSISERTLLASYSRDYNLLGSVGSDFHRPSSWTELGRNLYIPKDCTPVWSSWAPLS
ncbi:MAG: putative metal-dependent phosphoesterase TrpH [Moritella sp.]|jgi:predicted metal-dependent phosphoesterase TrpH